MEKLKLNKYCVSEKAVLRLQGNAQKSGLSKRVLSILHSNKKTPGKIKQLQPEDYV